MFMKITLACLLAFFMVHPLHITVTEIVFNEKNKSVEMLSRIFVDDLETTLRKRTNDQDLDILNTPKASLDQLMASYYNDHFKIALDGKAQVIHYLGHERDGDAFIFYIEVEKIKKWKTIQITNSLLTEMFDDQSNLVHVTVRGDVKSMRLTKDHLSDNLIFETK
jgi:hypothetical protein